MMHLKKSGQIVDNSKTHVLIKRKKQKKNSTETVMSDYSLEKQVQPAPTPVVGPSKEERILPAPTPVMGISREE